MRMRIFSLTATEKRLLKNLSWRATLKPYTAPGVPTRTMKKPKLAPQAPGRHSVLDAMVGEMRKSAFRARWAGANDLSPITAHPVSFARFEIGHTQRKKPALKAATSRVIAYRAVCLPQYRANGRMAPFCSVLDYHTASGRKLQVFFCLFSKKFFHAPAGTRLVRTGHRGGAYTGQGQAQRRRTTFVSTPSPTRST